MLKLNGKAQNQSTDSTSDVISVLIHDKNSRISYLANDCLVKHSAQGYQLFESSICEGNNGTCYVFLVFKKSTTGGK